MKIAICLDNNNGMMFNNRRQSRDSVLINNLIEFADGNTIFVSEYSKPLFPDDVVVSAEPTAVASKDDICFIEDLDVDYTCADELIIYRWNRDYPSDKSFNFDISANGFYLLNSNDFEGSSHEKITREIYERRI